MKVALIGGHSRSARAFVRFARANEPEMEIVAFARRAGPGGEEAATAVIVPDYDAIRAADLAGCAAVVNFVGVTRGRDQAELARLNTTLPALLANEAKRAGARTFIQLSSLSVHGQASIIGPGAAVNPASDYGRSKAEAERELSPFADSAFSVSLLRIPTIYGPNAPSKIGRLAAALERTPIFPAPRESPRRSIISHENLARVLMEILHTSRTGTDYAADPESFTLDLLTSVISSRPTILRLPRIVFQPLRLIAPSLHDSLYENMEIDGSLLLKPIRYPLRSTESSLADAFGAATRDR